jgi:hypothetical protein
MNHEDDGTCLARSIDLGNTFRHAQLTTWCGLSADGAFVVFQHEVATCRKCLDAYKAVMPGEDPPPPPQRIPW